MILEKSVYLAQYRELKTSVALAKRKKYRLDFISIKELDELANGADAPKLYGKMRTSFFAEYDQRKACRLLEPKCALSQSTSIIIG